MEDRDDKGRHVDDRVREEENSLEVERTLGGCLYLVERATNYSSLSLAGSLLCMPASAWAGVSGGERKGLSSLQDWMEDSSRNTTVTAER